MASINQNLHHDALPDFRNLGVILRVLLIVLALSLFAAMCQSDSWAGAFNQFLSVVALVQPALVLSLMILWVLAEWLRKLDYARGIAVVLLLEVVVVMLLYRAGQAFFPGDQFGRLEHYCALALASTALILYYFHLRSRALSPALMEARLQALQARIRPHFLFNSINAVLSLIRQEPKRAEEALEDMADLFRVLMADNRQLAPLEKEVALCRQYLELEHLRLGERLKVVWHVEKMPGDALIPPLLLQPLLENAVYHGIEPCAEPGEIVINIYRSRDQVHLVLVNPYRREGDHHGGNKMALANIRERLELHFDAEATLMTKVNDSSYQVHIIVPYVSEKNV
jgi:two-component system sensor histidine kinase AlgZ